MHAPPSPTRGWQLPGHVAASMEQKLVDAQSRSLAHGRYEEEQPEVARVGPKASVARCRRAGVVGCPSCRDFHFEITHARADLICFAMRGVMVVPAQALDQREADVRDNRCAEVIEREGARRGVQSGVHAGSVAGKRVDRAVADQSSVKRARRRRTLTSARQGHRQGDRRHDGTARGPRARHRQRNSAGTSTGSGTHPQQTTRSSVVTPQTCPPPIPKSRNVSPAGSSSRSDGWLAPGRPS